MKGTTLYTAKSGLEVVETTSVKKKGQYEEKHGRVRIRAFSLTNGKEQIRMLLTPMEAHSLSRTIKNTLRNQPKKGVIAIIHKSQRGEKESTSQVIVEYFQTKKGAEGVGIIVKRDENKINIPLDLNSAVYLADLLHYLAMEQSWWTSQRVEEETEEEVEEVPEVPNEDYTDELEDAF